MKPILLVQEMVWAGMDAMARKYVLFQAGANPGSDSYVLEWSVRTYSAGEVQTTVKIKECGNQRFLRGGSVDFPRYLPPFRRNLLPVCSYNHHHRLFSPGQALASSNKYRHRPASRTSDCKVLPPSFWCLPLPINPFWFQTAATSFRYYQNGSTLPPPPKKRFYFPTGTHSVTRRT